MSRTFDFSNLSIAERLQLVEDLWDSIVAEAPDEAFPMTPELAAEIDRRLAEHEADPSTAIPWDEVRARVLRGRRAPSE
jgi:putative addiction module component (TIGR02574 family)